MRNKSLWFKQGLTGVTIGGSGGGGQPMPLVIVTVIVLAMALITVYDATMGNSNSVNLNKEIPFKCTDASCGNIQKFTIKDLQKMQKPGEMGPMMGPMTLVCEKCQKKTLTQAVECPKCQEIFVMKMDPSRGLFDDKCPKCGESYAKAWQEKYRKEQGE